MSLQEFYILLYAKYPPETLNKGNTFSEDDKDKLEEMNLIFLERIKGK